MTQETLEEAAKRAIPDNFIEVAPKQKVNAAEISRHYFIAGAKWQAERMYTEEEVLDILPKFAAYTLINADERSRLPLDKWFEQFKKK